MAMTFEIEIEREDDGRWIAEVSALSGVLSHGGTRDQAVARGAGAGVEGDCRTTRTRRGAGGVPRRHLPNGVSNWPACKACRVLTRSSPFRDDATACQAAVA